MAAFRSRPVTNRIAPVVFAGAKPGDQPVELGERLRELRVCITARRSDFSALWKAPDLELQDLGPDPVGGIGERLPYYIWARWLASPGLRGKMAQGIFFELPFTDQVIQQWIGGRSSRA
jgi:hypothetical protein